MHRPLEHARDDRQSMEASARPELVIARDRRPEADAARGFDAARILGGESRSGRPNLAHRRAIRSNRISSLRIGVSLLERIRVL